MTAFNLPPGYWIEEDKSNLAEHGVFSPESREGSRYLYWVPRALFISKSIERLERKAWEHYAKKELRRPYGEPGDDDFLQAHYSCPETRAKELF